MEFMTVEAVEFILAAWLSCCHSAPLLISICATLFVRFVDDPDATAAHGSGKLNTVLVIPLMFASAYGVTLSEYLGLGRSS